MVKNIINRILRLFLTLLFLIIAINITKSQYTHFKTRDAAWKISIEKSFCLDGFCGWREYKIEGDTTINSMLYSRIYRYTQETFDPEAKKSYFAAIRNSIDEKRLYYIKAGKYSESVLYDFNIELNDTVAAFFDSAVVVLIDSIEIGPVYRKRYHLESLPPLPMSGEVQYLAYSLIEGIGSTNGLFETPSYSTIDFDISRLVCYKEEGIPIYPISSIPGSNACTSLTATDYFIEEKNQFLVSPNPANDYCIVSNSLPDVESCIYSAHGVYMDTYKLIEAEHKIDLSAYPPGVYSFQFMSKNKYIGSKMLIVE